MITLENQILDLSGIKSLAAKFAKTLKIGDVLLLKGDLGVGKTTFSKFIINNLHYLNNFPLPNSINSPTFPILLTYNLKLYEIYHYDFYRIQNFNEIIDLDFIENINQSISLIEWPELLINSKFKFKHYLITLELHSQKERIININYFD